jgi:hypothetical protein
MDLVTALARIELFAWLCRTAAASIVLYDDGVHASVPTVQSRKKVIEWLNPQLLPNTPIRNPFLSREIEAQSSPIFKLIRAVREAVANLPTLKDVATICNEVFRSRYTITALAGDGDSMLIRATGHGYWSLDASWTSVAPGHRLQDGPDYNYGLWVANTHRHALLTDRALFHDVDAIIGRPQQPPMRVTYTRGVVPFSLPDGQRYALSASAARDDIALRC